MKRLLVAGLIAVLAGCASVAKIDSGEQVIGERMVLKLEGSWNHVSGPGMGPAQVWTMEGLPVDQLLIYAGLKDGEQIHGGGGGPGGKTFNFRATMQPHEIVALFEGMLTRDGSTFELTRLEPMTFGGQKGFRFEYALVRKVDGVRLAGLGYGAVSKGELFAMLYVAPRLTFFSRHKARVEGMARAVLVKG